MHAMTSPHWFCDTEFSHHPVGKQRIHPPRGPSGIFYTAASGIWQTVWLEPVRLLLLRTPILSPFSSHYHLGDGGGGPPGCPMNPLADAFLLPCVVFLVLLSAQVLLSVIALC